MFDSNPADDLQFYPTPPDLARKMWGKFQNDVERVLEPSCGNADLLKVCKHFERGSWRRDRDNDTIFEACEIDLTRHAHLKEMGVRVVGHDFMKLSFGSPYSHIIMNPPFAQGVRHVLHAWNILWDGEIVALVNAESIRNPHTSERQFLGRLLAQHGSVEFVQGAFTTPETQRKTEVECAILYLRKRADASAMFTEILESLKEDQVDTDRIADQYEQQYEVAIPRGFIETQVEAFDLAVKAAKVSAVASAQASGYASRIGNSMEDYQKNESLPTDDPAIRADKVRSMLSASYKDLKDRAWTSILRSSMVRGKLSSKAEADMISRFEEIKKLEFTAQNVYSFLIGLAESAGEIQMSMVCEVFDSIVKYHSDNGVWYRGWKSNDAQRTMGIRVKARRFVLPNWDFRTYGSLSYGDTRRLEDFDRVFAMLDGKAQAALPLAKAIDANWRDFMDADRVQSTYFEVRGYKGTKTMHFYPRRPDLMDRLNRLVGRHRQWLPNDPEGQAKGFWKQYDQAEKFDAEFRKEVSSRTPRYTFGYRGPFGALALLACEDKSGYGQESGQEALKIASEAVDVVLKRHGITVESQLEHNPEMLRLAA
jgi:hypothetical protein